MKHQEADGDHLLLLTMEETDALFDVFDPMDNELPSHLHHQRHRFIKENVYDWLVENVGVGSIDWTHFRSSFDCRGFQFKDRQKAMLFKLTFQGVE